MWRAHLRNPDERRSTRSHDFSNERYLHRRSLTCNSLKDQSFQMLLQKTVACRVVLLREQVVEDWQQNERNAWNVVVVVVGG